jgi:hypothetical protein
MEATMKTMRISAAVVAALLMLASMVQAEQKASKPLTPLTVQVVFSEYEGDKKISSLPYTIPVNADDSDRAQTNLRIGVHVPIVTGGKDSNIMYENVGTDIDCSAESIEAGHFKVFLNVNRSSLYTPRPGTETEAQAHAGAPMTRRFEERLRLLMRDGQTIQSATATDPATGRVWKVDVTLHVVKGQD